MIPDKIYLPIVEEEGKKLLCTIWWDHDTSKGDKYVKETIPYIRKDAILERLKGYNHPITRIIVKK